MSAFTCPECGSHQFWSLSSETRMCHGYRPSTHPHFLGVSEPCVFTWTSKDDAKYGLSLKPTDSGVFDVGSFVSDAL